MVKEQQRGCQDSKPEVDEPTIQSVRVSPITCIFSRNRLDMDNSKHAIAYFTRLTYTLAKVDSKFDQKLLIRVMEFFPVPALSIGAGPSALV